ncbi:MAG: hypothetical protein EOR35_06050 [Mesorhizobium sp.]|nr:MAG: hypothetical protein EOR35_06050 [Mesorhizobium sp.]
MRHISMGIQRTQYSCPPVCPSECLSSMGRPSSRIGEKQDAAMGNLSFAVEAADLNELVSAHKSALAMEFSRSGQEVAARRNLLAYRAKSKREALDKLIYVSAFLICTKATLESDELTHLLTTVDWSD